MFNLQKNMVRLDIPSRQVLHLQRSLSPVQIALPGFPSQEATAFVGAFAAGRAVRVAVAFYLQSSSRVAFYLDSEGDVSQQEAGRSLKEAIHFAESLGFLLGDLDVQRLDPDQRSALWNSLPLKTGRPGGETAEPGTGKMVGGASPAGDLEARKRNFVNEMGRFLASL